jgi:2-succinyl-6-hydroxy-2,4-cyclohexadiene-1-carboxylate synthase
MVTAVIVDAGDARLRVEVSGTGSPIVVLHGFTGSAAAMRPVTRLLDPAHRMIAPDLVGHGRSDPPTDPDSYTVEAMVRHVLAVADVLRCSTFHLVGYSMGGRVALALGCHVGHRLRSLTLIGATAGLVDEERRVERRGLDEARARHIESDFEGFVDDWMDNPLFASQSRLGHDFLMAARAQRLASRPEGLAASLRAAGTGSMTPLHDRLGQCTMPTMLVVGGEDVKFRALATELSGMLPRSSTSVIPDAGHAAHLEQPVAVADRIREFVSAIEVS